MQKYIHLFIFILSFASCIAPGKLNEAIDKNLVLNMRYDSLQIKLTDTIANFRNNLNELKTNLNSLQDSVSYYQAIASKPPVISEGDIFLNQILGLSLLDKSELKGINTKKGVNGGNNVWLDGFIADMKKYTSADADVHLNKGYVFVDISDKILFNSGSNTLTKKSKEILATIAALLLAQPDLSFMIEGHTDNKGFIGNKNDNWNLSVNRAITVAKILQTKYKINPKRIIAAGRSEYMPIDDNKTKLGRSNNRCIRIVLMPSLKQLMNLNN